MDQHLESMKMVLCTFQAEGLKAKLSKCCFFQNNLHYLGHVISSHVVSTDQGKIEVVL